jgi:ppGpp synthetase/RelA/SpoT-type nucleotidyltranferase
MERCDQQATIKNSNKQQINKERFKRSQRNIKIELVARRLKNIDKIIERLKRSIPTPH